MMDVWAKLGGLVLTVAGAAHMISVAVAGVNSLTLQLVPIGMLYVGLGVLTVSGRRGFRWLAAITSALGLIAAVQVMPTSLVPSALMWSYVWLDVVTISALSISISKTLNSA